MSRMNDPDLPAAENRVLAAVRLGWLTVEVFGRLRSYVQTGRKLELDQGEASRRFKFSDRRLSERDLLFLAVDQLHHLAAGMALDLPALPLPSSSELGQLADGKPDLDRFQGQLDAWSTQVWLTLSTAEELLGRAFTYGGSLADTYWQAPVLGPDRFAELVRPQRLEYIAARLDSLAGYLPPYTAGILHCTLYKWRDQADTDHRNALRRLEAQARVWHDLLFGSRSADSYLRTRDQRLITAGALGATAILILVVIILLWLMVLTLSSTGLTVAASMTGLRQEITAGQPALAQDLLDWQQWSVLLATLSSIVAILIGLVTRLSGWIIKFYDLAQEWLTRRQMCRRTYRGPKSEVS